MKSFNASEPAAARSRPRAKPEPVVEKPTRPDALDPADDPYGLNDLAGEGVPPAPVLAPVTSRSGKKKSSAASPDWRRLLDEAPRYVLLGIIALTVLLGLSAGLSRSGRAFLPTGFWLLYWGAGYVVLLGLVLVAFREGVAWGVALMTPWLFDALFALRVLPPQARVAVYVPYALFALYYIVSRWRQTFPWFGLTVVNGVIFGAAMAGLPELRERYTAYSQRQRAEVQQHFADAQHPAPGAAANVRVEVTGLSDPETIEDFSQQLLALSSGRMVSHEMGGKRVYEIATNSGPQEIARLITWAKVTGVEGGTVQVAATSLFGGQPRPPEGDFIGRVLYDLKAPRSSHCREALNRLQRTPPDPARRAEVAAAIEPVLKAPEGFTQIAALQALALWGGKENTPAILPLLRDNNIFVVSETLKALAVIKDPSTAESVAAFLAIDQYSGQAVVTLKALGTPAESAVLKYLDHGMETPRRRALEVLKSIGTEACIPAVREVLRKSGDRGFDAMLAREVLARVETPAAAGDGEGDSPAPSPAAARRNRRPR